MTSAQNDKFLDGHLFGMSKILLYKYFIRKYFFAVITSQVFLKHPPGHKESIDILGNKIRQWKVPEKSRQTDRQTDTRTSPNYYMDESLNYVTQD